MTARDTDKRRRFDNQTKPAHGEFEDYLFEIQQEIKDSDEEDNARDDQNGTLFGKNTKLYEDYKLTGGSIADQWVREAYSKLQLNWWTHPTELSHYSHGDCGGPGFTSTMEKKLDMKLSNQTYQPRTQQVFIRTELISTQDWELVGVGPTRGFHGVAKPGTDLSNTDGGRFEVDFSCEYGISGLGTGAGAGVELGGGNGGV
jgi:hypothetical protein